MQQTTIIISHLGKDDFIAESGRQLSLANQIKLALLNLTTETPDHELYQDMINWSNLPFLNRIIVIFNNEKSALIAYKYLEGLYHQEKPFTMPPTVKISLQENLLRRSKLSDALSEDNALDLVKNLGKFRNAHSDSNDNYQEPEPKPFDTYEDLMKLGIDVTKLNSTDLLPSPIRSRSSTKTLFRPMLQLSTDGAVASNEINSPTITLDELS